MAKRTNVPGMKQFRPRRFNPYAGYRYRRPFPAPYMYSPYGYGSVLCLPHLLLLLISTPYITVLELKIHPIYIFASLQKVPEVQKGNTLHALLLEGTLLHMRLIKGPEYRMRALQFISLSSHDFDSLKERVKNGPKLYLSVCIKTFSPMGTDICNSNNQPLCILWYISLSLKLWHMCLDKVRVCSTLCILI